MNVRVTRTGGFAGVRVSAEADTSDDPELAALVRRVHLDRLPQSTRPEPDRFVYTIEIAGRSRRVGESALTGPLEELVRRVLG